MYPYTLTISCLKITILRKINKTEYEMLLEKPKVHRILKFAILNETVVNKTKDLDFFLFFNSSALFGECVSNITRRCQIYLIQFHLK